MNFSQALNEIHSNIWGFLILCIGAAVALRGHADIGNTLIATGAVLLKQSMDSTNKTQ